jgi:hypothetical protein
MTLLPLPQMDKEKYSWTMMIVQPDWITRARFARAIGPEKAKRELLALSRVRFESYAEGRALQVLHIGSYGDEARSSSSFMMNTCRNTT